MERLLLITHFPKPVFSPNPGALSGFLKTLGDSLRVNRLSAGGLKIFLISAEVLAFETIAGFSL